MSDKPFFIGFLPAPAGLRGFLIGAAALLVAIMAAAGFALGTAQDDPGEGTFRFDYGRQTVKGVVELVPYPLIHVTEGNDNIQPGETFFMSAGGKAGVGDRAAPFDGKVVQVSGVMLERGDLYMLQLRGGRNGLRGAEGSGSVPEVEDLGRWRLAGEICDGKCLSGAMRPGRGLAHKACANLCLLGDVPPVFVSSQPVEGSEFLLITGPDGTKLPEEAYDYVAQYVSVEGQIRRHGDLLVFAIDPATLELTP